MAFWLLLVLPLPLSAQEMKNNMDLKLISEFSESSQYRSKSAFHGRTARQVVDHAFMDMIAVWILYNEPSDTADARDYASKTAMYNRFTNYRQMATDLYLNMHVITQDRTDLLTNADDVALLTKIQLDERQVIRYLKMIERGSMNKSFARQALQRLEQALYIQSSNYRSVRRLAQNWPGLTTSEKRAVITRMMFFYRTNAPRSEMYKKLKALAKSNNYVDALAVNPEAKSSLKRAAAAAAVGAAAGVTGYALGSKIAKSLM